MYMKSSALQIEIQVRFMRTHALKGTELVVAASSTSRDKYNTRPPRLYATENIACGRSESEKHAYLALPQLHTFIQIFAKP